MSIAAKRSMPRLLLQGTLVLAGAVLLVLFGRRAGAVVPEFTAWVESLGVWGPVVFIVGYALATVAFVPGLLLTLAAGAIFGVVWGSVYVFAGAVIGASAAFLIARYLARRAVERRLEGNEKFAAVDQAVGEQGRKIVFLLRLSPVFPYNLLNYALGLTRVRFVDYLAASVGMIPGTLLYVYSGKIAGDLAAVAGGTGPARGTEYYVVLTLGLFATVAVTLVITRLARKALSKETTR
jgi:uncharacterized membrane protein YdjX (TVP38/TMEM64 family)